MIKPLSEKNWIKSFEFAPRVACNLIVLDHKQRVLLTKRAIKPEINKWHVPGSFIRKGERIEECIKRIGRNEINIAVSLKKVKFLGLFENLKKDPRGHIIDLFYIYKTGHIELQPNKENSELKFFDKLPGEIGFNHKESLNKMGFN